MVVFLLHLVLQVVSLFAEDFGSSEFVQFGRAGRERHLIGQQIAVMVLSSFHCFDDHFAFEVVPFVLVVVPGVSANQYAVKLSFLLDGLLQIAPTSREGLELFSFGLDCLSDEEELTLIALSADLIR